MSVRFAPALVRIRRLKRDLPLARIARRNGQNGEKGGRKNRFGGASDKTWGSVSTLLFLILLVLCGRAYLGQRLALSEQAERVLRTQIAPQLEKQIGAKVEFGRVETDWLGRVIVRDVFIGRDAKLPTGALLRAREISVSLDLPGLALGRAALPTAIRSVAIRSPQIYLRRDARGFNLARLLPKNNGGKTTGWNGHISVSDGRVYYLDTTLKNAEKQPLTLDARGIDAQFVAATGEPYRGAAHIETPLLGAKELRLQPITGDGSLEIGGKSGLFSMETGAAPFAPLASYAFPRREIIARQTAQNAAQNGAASGTTGTIGGRAALVLSNGKVRVHGALRLENLAFTVPAVRVPGAKAALQIEALSGPFEFADDAFSTRGARLQTLGSRFDVAGAASLQAGLPFDFTLHTPALPLSALRVLAPRGTDFSAAPTSARAHLSGNAGGVNRQIAAFGTLETARANFAVAGARLNASGAVSNTRPEKVKVRSTIAAASAATATLSSAKFVASATNSGAISASSRASVSGADFSDLAGPLSSRAALAAGAAHTSTADSAANSSGISGANGARGTLRNLRTSWTLTAKLRPDNSVADWKIAARARVGASRLALKTDEIEAQGAVFSVRAARGAGLEIGADAPAFAAISPRYGRTAGRNLHLIASAPAAKNGAAKGAKNGGAALGAFGAWSGALSVSQTATGGVRWGAVSPALSRTLKSSGALDLNARFAGLNFPLNMEQLRGAATFRLAALQLDSRVFALPALAPPGNAAARAPLLRDADFSLRTLQGRIALESGVIELSRAAAVSSFGPLRLDARVPLQTPNAARVALSLPDVRIAAERIAPFLRAQQVQLRGDWRGRVTLFSRAIRRSANATSANAKARATGVHANASAPSFGVEFALQAPDAILRGEGKTAGAVNLSAATWRGTGDFSLQNTAQSWRASGVLQARLGSLRGGNLGRIGAIPGAATGARARDLRLEIGSQAGATSTSARLSAAALSVPVAVPVSKRIAATRINATRGAFLTLTNLSADLENGRGGAALPRFGADFAGGELQGTLRFTPRGARGEVLARDIDAARVQQLVAPASREAAQLSGLANGLVEIRPGAAPRAEIRLDSGAVRVFTSVFTGTGIGAGRTSKNLENRVASGVSPRGTSATNGSFLGANDVRNSSARAVVFPLQNARAKLVLASDGTLQISDARVWSAGMRIAGGADLRDEIWRGQVAVSGARLAALAQLPWAPLQARAAHADGLLGAAFDFVFDAGRAHLTSLNGNADLRLAEVFGARIEALHGNIGLHSAENSAPILTLSDWNGTVEGAAIEGAASADFARNLWQANLSWSGAQTARLARLQALLGALPKANNAVAAPSLVAQTARADALAGAASEVAKASATGAASATATASEIAGLSEARAQILERAFPVAGTLGGQLQLGGTLFDARGDLAPRARDGAARLDSDALVWRGRELGTLEIEAKLENGLVRVQTLQLARTAGSADVPLVQISGVLPLDASAPGLDAQLHIGSAPLAFFTGIAAESREALRASGVNIPFFERAVSYVDALPAGTSGQIALDAGLSGSWSAPRLRVSNLTLRDGRTRLPSGGFSPPSTLDAAFTFDKGTVTVEKTEFRLKKTVAPTTSTSGAAPVSTPDSDEDDDTLLRVEPGGSAMPDGPISLAADVFNANLSQLSPWVPALRGSDGAPLLRGDLSEFSFRVGGTTPDPAITGSIQGENLQLQNYTLDRLRVSRFEIGGGSVRIEPGNLTVVKGAFQSSAPYGRVPWSWAPLGPVLDGPIDVHFPLQTRDFGALAGAFVPALSVADAGEFSGSVDVAGTLRAPALSGAITIKDGQFRLDETRGALAAGLQQVSGTVRFVGATEILIDADDPLRGKLVSANQVVGRAARRAETAPNGASPGTVRSINPPIAAARGAAKTVTANAKGEGANAKTSSSANTKSAASKNAILGDPNLKLAGDFVLRGGVVRPVQIDALLDTPEELPSNSNLSRAERRASAARLRALLDPAAALSRLKYDLSLELSGGAFGSSSFGGISDVSAGLIWKTGDDDAQNVRWMLAARGQKTRASKNGGDLTSFGAVALQRNFGAGFDALARSAARDFGGEADFRSFSVAKRIDVTRAPDRRAQFNFNRFAASLTGAGNGVLDGRLVLDNGAAQQKAPDSALRLQNAALKIQPIAPIVAARGEDIARIESDFAAPFGSPSASTSATPIERDFALGAASKTAPKNDFASARLVAAAGSDDAPSDENGGDNGGAAPENSAGEPLRLGGVLTLSSAEIYGAPEGGAGAALLLSQLPGAPRFDVRLKMGRDVQVVTSAFRSSLDGELVAQGTPRDPRISGVLDTRGGQVRFPNARARVDEGRVSILLARDATSDALRTRLEIDATARGQSGRYAIVLNLHGPLDLSGAQNAQSLQIDVTSTPPLSQSEAFEQLLGTAPDLDYDEKTGTYKTGSVNAAYTNAVLNVLSAPLFSGVEQSLAQTLGLTSVGFEYRFNEPLAVQVTKALGDRIFLSYRRSLGSGPAGSIASSTSAGRTPFELRIEYRIKGNYLLGLQTDERQIPTLTLQKTVRF